jgi:hypothetical protein
MKLGKYRKLPYWPLHTHYGKYISANAGTNDMGAVISSDRIAATLWSLGTWVASGIYV